MGPKPGCWPPLATVGASGWLAALLMGTLGTRPDAPKLKVDVGFMKLVQTDAEWQREVLEAGPMLLCIVDIFSPVWGPCEMAAGHLTNYFFDMGDTYGMKFIRADNSKINECIKFRDSAKPTFQFYLNGEVVDEVDGANVQKIKDIITSKAPNLKAPNWQ